MEAKRQPTTLEEAVKQGKTSLVEQLLESKVSVNTRGLNDVTPLMLAAQTGNTSVVCLLLEHNADMHATDNNGDTFLYYAARNKRLGLVQRLLRKEDLPSYREDIQLRYTNNEGHTVAEVITQLLKNAKEVSTLQPLKELLDNETVKEISEAKTPAKPLPLPKEESEEAEETEVLESAFSPFK